jgi:ethanolamine utilization protein EutN
MEGFRLLVMQPLDPTGGPDGEPLLVVDAMGAAIGSVALVSNDGKSARALVGSKNSPVRYHTTGLEDER